MVVVRREIHTWRRSVGPGACAELWVECEGPFEEPCTGRCGASATFTALAEYVR